MKKMLLKLFYKGSNPSRPLYNERGEEIPDSTKPEIPLGFKKPESLAEQVARLVKSAQLREQALASGHETFEEADDFEVGEDYDPKSPYEESFDLTAPRKEGSSFTEEKPMGKGASDGGSLKKPAKPKAKKAPQGSGGAKTPVSSDIHDVPDDSEDSDD